MNEYWKPKPRDTWWDHNYVNLSAFDFSSTFCLFVALLSVHKLSCSLTSKEIFVKFWSTEENRVQVAHPVVLRLSHDMYHSHASNLATMQTNQLTYFLSQWDVTFNNPKITRALSSGLFSWGIKLTFCFGSWLFRMWWFETLRLPMNMNHKIHNDFLSNKRSKWNLKVREMDNYIWRKVNTRPSLSLAIFRSKGKTKRKTTYMEKRGR